MTQAVQLVGGAACSPAVAPSPRHSHHWVPFPSPPLSLGTAPPPDPGEVNAQPRMGPSILRWPRPPSTAASAYDLETSQRDPGKDASNPEPAPLNGGRAAACAGCSLPSSARPGGGTHSFPPEEARRGARMVEAPGGAAQPRQERRQAPDGDVRAFSGGFSLLQLHLTCRFRGWPALREVEAVRELACSADRED